MLIFYSEISFGVRHFTAAALGVQKVAVGHLAHLLPLREVTGWNLGRQTTYCERNF
jgi:hypothetical protein